MRKGPDVRLIRNDATPRRMRVRGRQLRTAVGYATMFDPGVETVDLDAVATVSVLAPYAPPGRRLTTLGTGAALGIAAAAGVPRVEAWVVAVVVATLAAVAAVARGPRTRAWSLARLGFADGGDRVIAFRQEDEHDVRAMFPKDAWRDDNLGAADDAFLPEEEGQLERIRVGLVLAASGLCLAVLAAIYQPDPGDGAGGISTQILEYAAIAITLFVGGKAWHRIIAERRGRIAAASST